MLVHSRTYLVATLLAAAGCRSVGTSYTPGTLWQPGAPVLVLPARAGTFDAEVAARVADRLRQLGGVRVLAAPPGLAEGTGDDQRSCEIARQAGARYVVLARGNITASRTEHCFVSTGVLRHIVIPIVIPVPLPGRRGRIVTGTIENPLGVEGKCIVAASPTWSWSKGAHAQVLDTETCAPTGGRLHAADGKDDSADEPAYDLAVLSWQIRQSTPDLFPSQAVVVQARGGQGVAVPSRGIEAGEVYELRKPSRPGWTSPRDRLAYVRRIEGDRIVVEPYAGPIDLARGDVLIRRGRVNWAELSPFAAASMLSVEGEHALLVGGGGRLRGCWHSLLFGISGEYLTTQDADLAAASGAGRLFNFGLEAGVIRHIARRVDLYGLVSGGATLARAAGPDSGGAGGYLGAELGVKLTFGRLFVDGELGGIYSTSYGDQDGLDVHQRAPVARAGVGLNFWPEPVEPFDTELITGAIP